jgi:GNAT superfamily N-acetyltransferase
MNRSELLELYDRQVRIDLEQPGVRREVFPHLVRQVRPSPGMNTVSYSRLEGMDLDAVIDQEVAYFRSLEQPFSWQVCEHDAPPVLKERLLAHGFRPEGDPDAVLVLELAEAPPALREPVPDFVRPVRESSRLPELARLQETVYGGNFGWMVERLGGHLQVPGYLDIFLASPGGEPSCCGWIYFHPNSQFAGLYGGSTLPERRGQGLYTAVLAARVQAAIRRGYRFLHTGASPMSRPILERNGFRRLTRQFGLDWEEKRKERYCPN